MDDAKIPTHAELLLSFANTVDHETGDDQLTKRAELTGWLHEHGLLQRRTPSTEADLQLARDVRAGLREAMSAHHGGTSHSDLLERAAAQLPLQVCCSSDEPSLRPVHTGVRGALSELMVAVSSAVSEGSWGRLKICPADDCHVAFYDGSKNRSKTWCAMGVCGNRAKTRTYRARQRLAR